MKDIKFVRLAATLLLLGLIVVPILAQGNTINYGDTVSGIIDANSQQGLYTFSGNAGDQISAYAIGVSGGLDPSVGLLGPGGQLDFQSGYAFTPIGSDAGLSFRLPDAGLYNVFVNGDNGTQGQYALTLQVRPAGIATTLVDGQSVPVPLAGTNMSLFNFLGTAGGQKTINICSGTPGLGFAASLYNPTGQVINVVQSNTNATMIAPALDGTYELIVESTTPEIPGQVEVALGVACSGSTTSAPPPVTTQEAAPPDNNNTGSQTQPPVGVCSVTGGGTVNIRDYPDVNNSNVIGQLLAGNYFVVSGQSNGWYSGDYNGQTGWISASVVGPFGPCGSLPAVDPGPAPGSSGPAPTQDPGPSTTEQPTEDPGPATEEPTQDPGPATEEPTQDPGPVVTEQPTEQATEPPPPPTATTPPPTATTPPPTPTEEVVENTLEQLTLNLNIKDNTPVVISSSVANPGNNIDKLRVNVSGFDSVTTSGSFQINIVCDNPAMTGCGFFGNVFVTDDSYQRFYDIELPSPGAGSWTATANSLS